ncbi:MAG: DUF1826 domain-containing protein [Cytophagaceae bacterium]
MKNTTLKETEALHFLCANTWDDLHHIQEPAYNIALLKRPKDEQVAQFIHAVLRKPFKSINLNGPVDEILEQFKNKLIDASLINEGGFQEFMKDVEEILRNFSTLSGSEHVRLLFSVVNTNMCRLFHTDINDLRLLCTYSGPGTIWVKNSNIRKRALGYEKNEDLLLDSNDVEQTEPFEIVILKGALHPANNSNPVFHRSPTIEETGEQRVLLRLDTSTFLSDFS